MSTAIVKLNINLFVLNLVSIKYQLVFSKFYLISFYTGEKIFFLFNFNPVCGEKSLLEQIVMLGGAPSN